MKILATIFALFLSFSSISYGYTYWEAEEMYAGAQLWQTYANGDYNSADTYHAQIYARRHYLASAIDYFTTGEIKSQLISTYLTPVNSALMSSNSALSNAIYCRSLGNQCLINAYYDGYCMANWNYEFTESWDAYQFYMQSCAYSVAQGESSWTYTRTADELLSDLAWDLMNYGWDETWQPT